MKEEVSFNRFYDVFEIRRNNFSYKGLEVLYDYLIELEEDTGTELELDVIAICCNYNEYKDLNEYLNDNYTTEEINEKWKELEPTFPDNYEEEDKRQDFKEMIEEEITNKTTLIKISDDLDDGFIVGVY